MPVLINIIFPNRAGPVTSDTMPNNSGGIGVSRGGKSSGFSIRRGAQPRAKQVESSGLSISKGV